MGKRRRKSGGCTMGVFWFTSFAVGLVYVIGFSAHQSVMQRHVSSNLRAELETLRTEVRELTARCGAPKTVIEENEDE